MKKSTRKMLLSGILTVILLAVCACHANPSQEQLCGKLFAHFEQYGFECKLIPLAPERDAPIYKAAAWQSLLLNGEEVLLYFDDSNRADYLTTFVDETVFGPAWRFGLRFVLVYDGRDAKVLEALNAIENE